MAELLKAALVGCGRIGAHTRDRLRETMPAGWIPLSHVEAMRSESRLKLVAVCDADAARAEATAREFDVAGCYTDHGLLLSEVKPDILSIATRTGGRCDIIRDAAENGVRGLHSEKPLGRSLGECRGAIRAVEAHGVHLTYGTTRRFMEAFRTAREMAEDGRIGEVRQVSVELGRTNLMWNHPHSFDVLIFLAGCDEVEYCQGSCAIDMVSVTEEGVDSDPILEFGFAKFANGVNGLVTCGSGNNFRIDGTRGKITVAADGRSVEWSLKKFDDRPYLTKMDPVISNPAQSGTERAFADLAGAVLEGEPMSITTKEIELGCALTFGMVYSSLHGGKRVAVKDLPEAFAVTGRQGELYA